MDVERVDEVIDVKDAPPQIQNFQDKGEQRNAAEHHVGHVADERFDKEAHLSPVLAHLFLRAPFDPTPERGGLFCLVSAYGRLCFFRRR